MENEIEQYNSKVHQYEQEIMALKEQNIRLQADTFYHAKRLLDLSSARKEINKLEELVKYIYQSDTARWWMKYKINEKFPQLVKMLNKH